MLNILILILGLLLLSKGADLFVQGASIAAKRLRVSPMMIGLTVVAFGTSAPELAVNIFATTNGNTGITFGNIIGSNISNILLILGVAALIRPLGTEKNTIWREIPFALLGVLVLIILVNDSILGGGENVLGTGDALILLLFFAIFMVYVFGMARVTTSDEPEIKEFGTGRTILYLLIGLAGLLGGGQLLVSAAIDIATQLGVSERVIGLTIVAIGTSLPELMTSAIAAYRGQTDIAIGNVIGSNIFNIFFILGISGLVSPLPFRSAMNLDLGLLLLASVLLFVTMFTGGRRVLDRWEASIFLVLYVSYTVYLFLGV